MHETCGRGLALAAIGLAGHAIEHVPGGAARQQACGVFQGVAQQVAKPLPAADAGFCVEVPVARQGVLQSDRQGKGEVQNHPFNDGHIRLAGAIGLIGQARRRSLGQEAAAFVDDQGQVQGRALAQVIEDDVDQALEIPAAPLVGGGQPDRRHIHAQHREVFQQAFLQVLLKHLAQARAIGELAGDGQGRGVAAVSEQ
ncbi:hypothetical protein PSFL_02200 [Pseudomonas sp. DD1]